MSKFILETEKSAVRGESRLITREACEYRTLMRERPALHKFLEFLESRSGRKVQKMFVSHLWQRMSSERALLHHSPTYHDLCTINTLIPSLHEMRWPDDSVDPVSFWLGMLEGIIVYNKALTGQYRLSRSDL